MKYFDENPKIVRLLVGMFTLYLSILAAVTFYRYTSSPTDENWFRNSSSSLYVVKDCAGVIVSRESYKPLGIHCIGMDSIRVGDLLLSVNGKVPVNPAAIDSIVKKASGDSLLLSVDRSTENTGIVFKVVKSSITSGIVRIIPPTAYVFDVIENGASDHAGMKIGDLIVTHQRKGI